MDVCCVCDEKRRRAEQLHRAWPSIGVHVVAEKPLTTTLADLKRVRERGRRPRAGCHVAGIGNEAK